MCITIDIRLALVEEKEAGERDESEKERERVAAAVKSRRLKWTFDNRRVSLIVRSIMSETLPAYKCARTR